MNRMILPAMLLLAADNLQAQQAFQNNGNLQVHSGASICSYGAFTNSSTGALINNGSLYVKGDLTNNQSAMPAGSGVLYLNGSSAQAVNGAQSFNTYQLNTNNAAGITLNNNLRVANVHTFTNGMIITSATPNYLIYEAGASYTGDADSRHVNGWIKKLGNTDFTFPVGNNTYERSVAISNLSATSELDCGYHAVTPNITSLQSPVVNVNPNEYWEVNKVSGGTAQLTLNWDNSKVAFPQYQFLSDLRAAYYNGSQWVNEGGNASGTVAANGSITSNTMNSYGYFAIGSIGYLLPMHFISVGAQRKTGATEVRWKTASEDGVDRYEVERMNTNGSFGKIGSVKSHNSLAETEYMYMDGLPLTGTAMYRVRSVDKDGQYFYSRIVSVSENSTGAIVVLNNPAHEAIYVSASAAYKGKYHYELFSTSGQLMQSGSLSISGGDIVTIPLTMKPVAGIYLLNIRNEEHRFAKQITIK